MPQTDTPFKRLVNEFALDFAAWLLNVSDADVHHIQPFDFAQDRPLERRVAGRGGAD